MVDTSVWVDYLRGADSVASTRLRRLLGSDDPGVVICEPIAIELLAGPTDPGVVARVTKLVDGLPTVAVDPLLDFRTAAAVTRARRRSGETIRSLNDCLIAAVAIRGDVAVAHRDVDFDRIAAVTSLRVESWF